MRSHRLVCLAALLSTLLTATAAVSDTSSSVSLPDGVKAVWDLNKAYRETTPTRERICINGLWLWQPAENKTDSVPTANWGYFKVPGNWPGTTDYMQKDSQTVYAHPSWKNQRLQSLTAAWYQREISVPAEWTGRRVALSVEFLNSSAAVFVDGKKVGDLQFPAGEVDLTAACPPGSKHTLSLRVSASPFQDVAPSFGDTNAPRWARARVDRRGLCGDVYLLSTPTGPVIDQVRVTTSFRQEEITCTATLGNLAAGTRYTLHAVITDHGRPVKEFTSKEFQAGDLKDHSLAWTEKWQPEKLWDIHTPQNQYEATVTLREAGTKVLDVAHPVRFGFREFWIKGRDFYLNGTRIFLSALPIDNAQVSAAASTYEAAKETMLRLKSIGINFVYTHNYGCEPGTHLSFREILKAADDVGLLVSFSQPHFGQYDWQMADADQKNGYARHARFYVQVAGNHPSVVFYSMSHNSTGYDQDMNPDLIDGLHGDRSEWAANNLKRALRAEAIVAHLDPSRIVYHHSSGNLGSMHNSNFYTNMAPIQELDDWFEHWAAKGVKPMFTCEYMVPCTWDFTMYRGWYKGTRTFGNATVPWEFCSAEWCAQFLGDRAYQISEPEKRNLRWEAEQFRVGNLWHRWDYPNQVGSRIFQDQHTIVGQYLASNWRAFRTWGLSANSPWEYHFFWTLRDGVDKSRKQLPVDWDSLQRPGFSPDYLADQADRMDIGYRRSDWIPTADGQAILRNNQPLLAYIGGKAEAFTSKDHNFTPGETVQKQLIIINNSRKSVKADCSWSLDLPQPLTGTHSTKPIVTGEQERIPLSLPLPADLPPGKFELRATVTFSDGETQKDRFTLNVLPRPSVAKATGKIALFDPKGETAALLTKMGVSFQSIEASADLSSFDILIVGKGALTAAGPCPDVRRVHDGLKVIVFEQTSEVLEKRFGFRVTEYGLRQVFKRVPDHPLLAGIDQENLHDWRGEATLLPPRLDYSKSRTFGGPAVKWCGIEVPHVWRCGNRGNVASVLIEKPAKGDFLPILDGGYSLQYSPLLEYREGRGVVLFCQVDVTGRTEQDPAAETLARNLMNYLSAWKPTPRRTALYAGDPAGQRHLEFSGISIKPYDGGRLSADQVLVVGPGGNQKLAANAMAVADFLKAGGHLLALGLDQTEAQAILPFDVRMKKAQHIAAFFESAGKDSLLAGVGPADVHNRAPRDIPLVSAGATVIGDGVLAKASDANVVFSQLPPWTVSRAEGRLPSFVVDKDEAVDGKASALLTMGSVTGQGAQFGQAIKGGNISVGKTYTFAAFVKPLGGPVTARLEVERPVRPWDRAVKGQDVQVPANRWTELHVTFKVGKPFAEGWFAYLSCAQEGARLRADLFRLYEGDYVPEASRERQRPEGLAVKQPRNLLTNPSFESGTKPWQFSYHEQQNLRRTYRRTSFQLARLLANMGVAAPTPLLTRFRSPITSDPPEKRWLDAYYLDQPEDWDDPYRFFRW